MYADLTSRIIAFVIDGIALGIVWSVVWSVIAGTLLFTVGFGILLVAGVILGLIWAAGSAAYFVYTWTRMRASLGQRVMKLETVNAGDGATLTQNQAIRRWAFLWGPRRWRRSSASAAASSSARSAACSGSLAFGYAIYLLYTVTAEPEAPGLPRCPGRHRGREAARLVAASTPHRPTNGAGPPAPFSFACPPDRTRRHVQGSKSRLFTCRGRKTASGRRSNAATRRIPGAPPWRPAARRRAAACARWPRASARPRAPGRPASGATSRIAPGDERLQHRVRRLDARARAGAAGPAPRGRGRRASAARPRARTRPGRRGGSGRRLSAAASTAHGSSRTAT